MGINPVKSREVSRDKVYHIISEVRALIEAGITPHKLVVLNLVCCVTHVHLTQVSSVTHQRKNN